MTEWQFTAAIASSNHRSLQRLIRAVALSKGQFALILVRCNYGQLRKQVLDNLRTITKDIYLREIELRPSTTANLHHTIVSDLYLDVPAVASDTLPSAVMVFGLELVTKIEDLLTGLNQARDIYADTLPLPLVLWLKDDVATLLSRLAPDFKSWAATTIKFEMAKDDLIGLIRNQTESLFAKVAETGFDIYGANPNLDSDSNFLREEIESAREDLLRLYNVQLDPQLEASLEFVLGRSSYINDQVEEALTHYQRSLALWSEDLEFITTTSDKSQDEIAGITQSWQYDGRQTHFLANAKSTPLLARAIVLFHLGLCYRRMSDLRPSLNRSYWQEALFWFKQSLELLESAQYYDLVAKFMLPACEMLQRLELWDELQTTAQKSLELHNAYGTKAQSAQDYGFLATVAASRSNWLQAYELATTARSIAETAPDVSRQQESWYLLLQGRSQRHLGEWEEAINNLEWAKVVCELQYEPSLYLEIVEELRSVYFFERHDYSEAFNLKQEKIQVEHQYGFRAFIGASQLQPQRYKINPGLELQRTQQAKGDNASYIPESVAQEIAASGRQKDISNLIERISRADCKLTIVHGPSGVGKSSILKAGLVPALHEKVVGDRIALPIVLSVYSDWVTVLGRSFNQAMAQVDLSISVKFTAATLLQKLRELTERNYTTILIFDQLEEFFFVVKDQVQRIQFYKFISECLNIAYVKVIFSLREDYLHYLLEFERLSHENGRNRYDLGIINKNILDKNIRYYLGKFSLDDAIGVIDILTQRSHYELSNELINQLVQDLAGEVEEVHPIELQIVGAQLQAEKITTLEEYQDSGGSSKLVERWLAEVIKDCGRENEQITWKLLFELTDEKGTRPLRTKIELALALAKNSEPGFNFESIWELILDILVGSGLVLRVPEGECASYQLVHDYLVEPIRKKNNYGIVAELEKVRFQKNRAEVAQKLSQEQLNFALQRRLREARSAGVILAMMTATIGGLWWQADLQKRSAVRETRRAERSERNLKISAISAASEALFASNKEFDALMESLRAWRKLQQADGVQPETKMRVVSALQQAVYGVKESNRLEGHTDIVWGVAYSPDGKLLASVSNDKTIKIWQPNGALVQTINAHNDAITSLSLSSDGQRLATSSLDNSIRVWKRKPDSLEFEQQPLQILNGNSEGVLSVNYSPDGQLLAASSKDKTVKLWDNNGNLVKILRGHQGWVHYVSFSPDGQLIASSSEDKTIKIWRRDGTLLTTLTGNNDGVTFVTFSPDSQILASGSQDNIIKLWRRSRLNDNNSNFVPIRTLTEHTNAIWSLSFSANGQQLASGSEDNTIMIWDVSDGSLLKTLKGNNDAVASVAFSPDGKTLASGSYDKSIKLWSLEPPALPVLEGHSDRVLNVAWSPDGKMLASSSSDEKVKLWERYRSNGTWKTRLYKTLVGHTKKIPSVAFDPKGMMLASGSYDKTIKLWRRDGSLLKTLTGHTDSIMSVSFSPDGELLASASKDKTIKLWNREGKLLKTSYGHQGWVNSVSFSSDGQTMASGSDDKTVRLWQRDGSFLKTLTSHDSWVLGVSFSPTDRVLASAGWDNTIKLWSWDGRLIKTLLKGYSDSVNAVNFSPNGEMLAAANWDSTVKLWSRDGKLLKTLNGHHAPVLGASFSPDGQTLASASADNTIILWNLDLNDLLKEGCTWVNDYLKYNRNVDARDRNLCEGVGR